MRDAARLWRRVQLRCRRSWRPIVTTTVGPHRLTYSVRDLYMAPALYLNAGWERHMMAVIAALPLEGKVAVDVGANVGCYTVALSDAVGASGRVIALEPDEPTHRLLAHNVAANQLTNVEVHRRGAGRTDSTAAFVRDEVNTGNHRVVPDARPGSVTVDLTSIDALTADVPDGGIGYIKIDVQGYEWEVVAGMHDTLQRNPDMFVQLELSASDRPGSGALVRQLVDQGWNGYEVSWDRLLPLQHPDWYEYPRFREQTDVLLSRDAERLLATLETVFVDGSIQPY